MLTKVLVFGAESLQVLICTPWFGPIRIKPKGDSNSMEVSPNAYTIKRLCAAYGVGRTFVYEQIAAGLLETRRAGTRKVLIRKVDADRWLDSLPKGSPASAKEEA
jgi:excisionase family DNA binding protein